MTCIIYPAIILCHNAPMLAQLEFHLLGQSLCASETDRVGIFPFPWRYKREGIPRACPIPVRHHTSGT